MELHRKKREDTMDATLMNSLIAAASGLIGALIGGAATIFATSRQLRSDRESEIKREERAAERERTRERYERFKTAAGICLENSLIMAGIVTQAYRQEPPDIKAAQTIVAPENQIIAQLLSLPRDLGLRFEEAAKILRYGIDIPEEPYHWNGQWAAYVVSTGLREATSSWLASGRIPPRSEEWAEFLVGAEEVESDYERQYHQAIGRQFEQDRENYRKTKAPELMQVQLR